MLDDEDLHQEVEKVDWAAVILTLEQSPSFEENLGGGDAEWTLDALRRIGDLN